MDERIIQFRVGAMVLAGLIITAILVVLFGGRPVLTTRSYRIYVRFAQAPGVSKDMPVRKFGIRIGRVADVGFAEDGDGAMVTTDINSDVQLRTDEICRIDRSLLGDAELEFIDDDPAKTPKTFLKDGDEVLGVVASDPIRVLANLEGSLSGAINSIGRTSDEIGELAARVGDILGNNDEQIARIVNKTEMTLDRFRATIESTDEVLSDPAVKDGLRRAATELPEVLDEARTAFGDFRTTLESVDRNLQNLEGLTRPLGERGEKLITNIESATMKLDRALTELVTFGDALNDPRGSLGQMLNNPDLYNDVRSAVRNVNELTSDLKPILRDARIFTDKIARDPGRLGVSGALRRDAGIKRSPSELMGLDGEESRHSTLRWGLGR